ncbi:ABC transporter [Halovenus sp. WSH3]|uniref:ABC transporter n=1 Tax=Halovenus carboxidivorans TaxID=2692199 RepID=A0A6B0T9E2_9EURY|nr:ABC transporter permease [Halovenus carboxidivorans]MXR51861.1 ABC transporter [Halovenus carboxidivorans]
MSLQSLLEKEFHWSLRNLLVLVFLLLLLPGFFAGTSVVFQDVLPRDVPVAVAPADEEVNETNLDIVEGTIATFTDPKRVDSVQQGRAMLERESVYAVIEVPPDLNDPSADAQFRLVVDGAIVPFLSPSEIIGDVLETEMDRIFDAEVTAEREVVGAEKTLPEYLFPTFLMTLVIFFAFTYVPYNLKTEAAVLDRLRVEASLESVVAAKLLFFTGLTVVPIVVFQAAALYYGYDVAALAPGAILTLLLVFLLVSTVSSTVMILSRFSGVGLFVNVTAMLGVVALSALAFPLGFFSSLRTTVAQLLPTYYAGIIARSTMLKGASLGTFADWLAMLIGCLIAAVVALEGSIIYYRRTS